MAGLLDFISLRDMVDGGGAGASGSTFKGGGLSDLLNGLGIRPMGAGAPTADMRPMARPAGLAPMARPMAPAAPTMAPPTPSAIPGAVETLPLGATPSPELIRMILQALQSAPSATGYGPR